MIAKKPTKASTAVKEKSFISKGANSNGNAAKGRQLSLKPVLVNFDQALLDRATNKAQNMGLNRNAFICMCVALYLDRGGE